ncbi:MAG: chemotaxis protein CheW, partial [Vicinamibacteria bacterium]|nr:chemotaxis protein CheW [Vicinamibacteria bacterium]
APLFAGHFTYQDQPYSVLDLEHLVNRDALEVGGETEAGAMVASVSTAMVTDQDPGVGQLPFILVEVAGEPYALRTEDVIEMVAVGEFRLMPLSPPWVAGLIDLRGTPLVAVSTALLLGRQDPGRQAVAVIVRHGAQGQVVALLTDRAVAIDRFPLESIHPMTEAMAGVESYLISRQESIIGIIVPSKLLDQVDRDLSALIPQVEAQAQESGPTAVASQRILTLRVGTELCAIPLERITRLLASVQLLPLSEDGRGFDAMADVGDGVAPVIDLRRQMTSSSARNRERDQPPCVLTTIEGGQTGILVDQILSIEDVSIEHYESVEETALLPISHMAYVQGRIIPVLTLDRLLPAM